MPSAGPLGNGHAHERNEEAETTCGGLERRIHGTSCLQLTLTYDVVEAAPDLDYGSERALVRYRRANEVRRLWAKGH